MCNSQPFVWIRDKQMSSGMYASNTLQTEPQMLPTADYL